MVTPNFEISLKGISNQRYQLSYFLLDRSYFVNHGLQRFIDRKEIDSLYCAPAVRNRCTVMTRSMYRYNSVLVSITLPVVVHAYQHVTFIETNADSNTVKLWYWGAVGTRLILSTHLGFNLSCVSQYCKVRFQTMYWNNFKFTTSG